MIYTDIQEQFNKIIAYSQGIPEPQTDELFGHWLEAKRDFIEAFGGQLIYEVPAKVSFSLNDDEKRVRLNDFIETVGNTYANDLLAEFLDDNADGFYTNVVSKGFSCNNIHIPKGMKLVKAFKYFESDKHILEMLQNQASQVIQEDKIEGTLCFSVHPLDFLSSSSNTYNWRSCHALDGEYRSGNLSYMVDKSTIICYLKGADGVELPLFPPEVKWNSKKWRMLLYVSDNWDMIFAGRQYPFSSDPALEIIRQHLLNILKLNAVEDSGSCWGQGYSHWSQAYVTAESTNLPLDYSYIPIRGELVQIDDVVEDGNGALHFNDILRSSCYTKPYYMVKNNYSWCKWEYSKPHFSIGGSVTCLHCGKDLITNPETMMCDECELDYGHEENDVYGVCDCCGARIVRDDAVSVGEVDLVCDNCAQTQCFICDCCDEVFYNADKIYDKENDDYVCTYCYNARREK